MINVSLPKIVIEPVLNGYLVVWQRPTTDEEKKKSAGQYVQMSKVAMNKKQLLAIIDEAVAV